MLSAVLWSFYLNYLTGGGNFLIYGGKIHLVIFMLEQQKSFEKLSL